MVVEEEEEHPCCCLVNATLSWGNRSRLWSQEGEAGAATGPVVPMIPAVGRRRHRLRRLRAVCCGASRAAAGLVAPLQRDGVFDGSGVAEDVSSNVPHRLQHHHRRRHQCRPCCPCVECRCACHPSGYDAWRRRRRAFVRARVLLPCPGTGTARTSPCVVCVSVSVFVQVVDAPKRRVVKAPYGVPMVSGAASCPSKR